MADHKNTRESLESLKAQYLVCGHLTRACRQAMSDIALDDDGDLITRRRAVEALKVLLADWADAQRWLRREISGREHFVNFYLPLIAVNNTLTSRGYPLVTTSENMHKEAF